MSLRTALCGKLLTDAWYSRIGLVSDDAPHFKLFGLIHGLCWVHGERKIDRLIPLTAAHRLAKEQSQQQFWDLYASLKGFRQSPTAEQRVAIERRFDAMSFWRYWTTLSYRCITIFLKTTFASTRVFARSAAELGAIWVDVAVTRS